MKRKSDKCMVVTLGSKENLRKIILKYQNWGYTVTENRKLLARWRKLTFVKNTCTIV